MVVIFCALCHNVYTVSYILFYNYSEVIKVENTKRMEDVIKKFDSFDYYLNNKIHHDIDENRKGQFVLNFKDADGKPLENVKVKVRQISHEFKFGCSLFHLDIQFLFFLISTIFFL